MCRLDQDTGAARPNRDTPGTIAKAVTALSRSPQKNSPPKLSKRPGLSLKNCSAASACFRSGNDACRWITHFPAPPGGNPEFSWAHRAIMSLDTPILTRAGAFPNVFVRPASAGPSPSKRARYRNVTPSWYVAVRVPVDPGNAFDGVQKVPKADLTTPPVTGGSPQTATSRTRIFHGLGNLVRAKGSPH